MVFLFEKRPFNNSSLLAFEAKGKNKNKQTFSSSVNLIASPNLSSKFSPSLSICRSPCISQKSNLKFKFTKEFSLNSNNNILNTQQDFLAKFSHNNKKISDDSCDTDENISIKSIPILLNLSNNPETRSNSKKSSNESLININKQSSNNSFFSDLETVCEDEPTLNEGYMSKVNYDGKLKKMFFKLIDNNLFCN